MITFVLINMVLASTPTEPCIHGMSIRRHPVGYACPHKAAYAKMAIVQTANAERREHDRIKRMDRDGPRIIARRQRYNAIQAAWGRSVARAWRYNGRGIIGSLAWNANGYHGYRYGHWYRYGSCR